MAKKLRNMIIFRPLFSIYDWVMKTLGLFQLKANWKRKSFFKQAALEDDEKRRKVAEAISALPDNMLTYHEGEENVIISMTSYGKRVASTAPYALYTAFVQEKLPNRIVLNLDETKWNDDNIPELLKVLKKKGLTINYCHDVGPHTKLLPTLKAYPNDVIVTFDDDVYYESVALSELLNAYVQSDRRTVLCREGKIYPNDSSLCRLYSQLPSVKQWSGNERVLPFGVAGVLYPPHLFSDEIFNEVVFRKLCPCADDIWFSIMEWRDGVKTAYIENNSWTGSQDVDRNEEYNPEVSGALYQSNDLQGRNDKQYSALIEYYKLR